MVEKKPEGDLKQIYMLFTAENAEMDNKQLGKFCRGTKIFDSKLTMKLINAKFAEYCEGGSKVMDYKNFQLFLNDAAKEKGITVEELTEIILKNGTPLLFVTQSDI